MARPRYPLTLWNPKNWGPSQKFLQQGPPPLHHPGNLPARTGPKGGIFGHSLEIPPDFNFFSQKIFTLRGLNQKLPVMGTVKRLNKWANAHTYYPLDLLRVALGIFL